MRAVRNDPKGAALQAQTLRSTAWMQELGRRRMPKPRTLCQGLDIGSRLRLVSGPVKLAREHPGFLEVPLTLTCCGKAEFGHIFTIILVK